MSELDAGHELDRLIAEKVMGWKQSDKRWSGFWYYSDTYDSHDCRVPFNPSMNIAHAWEVVEHLNARGDVVYLTSAHGGATAKLWIANDRGRYCVEDAPTAPLAICRAALRACS